MIDKEYCMSSYLMYRYVFNSKKQFTDNIPINIIDLAFERKAVTSAEDLLKVIEAIVDEHTYDGKAALALSGGIDSAILAKFMPKGSKVYTFRCTVPGKKVTDESKQASIWAKHNSLDHNIIDIQWKDVESVVDKLMLHKGAPIHSIEAQIYLAALRAKADGASKFIFGENADIIYGGMDGLLQKNWYFGEFVDRYMYVNPYYILKNPQIILEPFREFERDGHIDSYGFINKYFRQEALGTYNNACQTAGIEFIGPYSKTYLDAPVNYARIRTGDTKYIIREAFGKLYPNAHMPAKIPMPRPVNEWFANWKGPTRTEFIPHCTDIMTGDQKWMIWSLERFLNLLDKE